MVEVAAHTADDAGAELGVIAHIRQYLGTAHLPAAKIGSQCGGIQCAGVFALSIGGLAGVVTLRKGSATAEIESAIGNAQCRGGCETVGECCTSSAESIEAVVGICRIGMQHLTVEEAMGEGDTSAGTVAFETGKGAIGSFGVEDDAGAAVVETDIGAAAYYSSCSTILPVDFTRHMQVLEADVACRIEQSEIAAGVVVVLRAAERGGNRMTATVEMAGKTGVVLCCLFDTDVGGQLEIVSILIIITVAAECRPVAGILDEIGTRLGAFACQLAAYDELTD